MVNLSNSTDGLEIQSKGRDGWTGLKEQYPTLYSLN